eukprot:SAG31_NODE_36381_length_314_cov_0.539535_2_plen_55_part_01
MNLATRYFKIIVIDYDTLSGMRYPTTTHHRRGKICVVFFNRRIIVRLSHNVLHHL